MFPCPSVRPHTGISAWTGHRHDSYKQRWNRSAPSTAGEIGCQYQRLCMQTSSKGTVRDATLTQSYPWVQFLQSNPTHHKATTFDQQTNPMHNPIELHTSNWTNKKLFDIKKTCTLFHRNIMTFSKTLVNKQNCTRDVPNCQFKKVQLIQITNMIYNEFYNFRKFFRPTTQPKPLTIF